MIAKNIFESLPTCMQHTTYPIISDRSLDNKCSILTRNVTKVDETKKENEYSIGAISSSCTASTVEYACSIQAFLFYVFTNVLIEAVQNHTPEVVMIDKISCESEVQAVQTVKEHTVRCVRSARRTVQYCTEDRDVLKVRKRSLESRPAVIANMVSVTKKPREF